MGLLDIRFESGDEVRVNFNNRFELLDEPFEIHPGVVIPTRDLRVQRPALLEVETAERQQEWPASSHYTTRRVLVGRSVAASRLEFTLRPTSGLLFATDWEHNDISLPQGDFTTDVIAQRGEWQASPWMSLTAIVQFDNVSDDLGLFTRFRWILNPGNDLYVVYSHNWQSLESRWLTLDRAATTKINYTHRF